MTIIEAIILGIVEGVTEFLPISSTGHLVITSSIMGIEADNFTKLFTVAVQLGAILSVLVMYWRRFLQSIPFYVKIIVAAVPALAAGLLLGDRIDAFLENPLGIAFALLLGGIVLIFIDKLFPESNTDKHLTDSQELDEKPDLKTAFIIGVFQCLALFPGVSRSASSIIGGMTQKLTRRQAAEFSFFLAVPTMFAATAYKLLKYLKEGNKLSTRDIEILAIGNLVAFIVAMLAIRFFINYLSKKGFKVFGYYRIVIGLIIIGLYYSGYNLQII
ncbi:MAG: undecaprenyl-diphosphate phosphatase [Bacteroidota bacterium]|nr:undecaprenyl-diphosphate phosphatase [Bacteroidota bacterium]